MSYNVRVSKNMTNTIISYYLELKENKRGESVSTICDNLGIGDRTLRRFIEYVVSESSDPEVSKLYEVVMLHTCFQKGTELYDIQQKLIDKKNRQKNIMSKQDFIKAFSKQIAKVKTI